MSRLLSFGLVTLLLAGVGCSGDDDPSGPVNPVIDTGTLSVTAVTTGDDIDPDGYTLLIDNGESGSIGANVTAFRDLVVGSYLVELTDIAGNCAVSGSNPRTEGITKDATTATVFDVTCEATGP